MGFNSGFKGLTTSLASAPNSIAVSATRISLIASSSSLVYSRAMAPRPTIVCLVHTTYDWPELQKHYASKDTNVFHSESKTDLKLDVTYLLTPWSRVLLEKPTSKLCS